MGKIKTLLNYMPQNDIRRSIYISRDRSFIYISTPKCGCSSLKLTLRQKEAEITGIQFSKDNNFHRTHSPMMSIDEFEPDVLDRLLTDEKTKKITFVRNPYARALSAYLSKIAQPVSPAAFQGIRKSIYRRVGKKPDQLITFLEFLEAIHPISNYDKNEHWRPLTDQTFFNSIKYSRIGRFENFSNDFDSILSEIYNMPVKQYFRGTKTNSNTHIADYYCSTSKEIVMDIYHDDFINFEYPTDLPV